jgi:hypothetical protein
MRKTTVTLLACLVMYFVALGGYGPGGLILWVLGITYGQMLNAKADRLEPQATLGRADGCDNSNKGGA